AVGRAVVHDDLVAAVDGRAGQLAVTRRRTPHVHDGADPADDLLDGRWQQTAQAGLQSLSLVGMLEEREQAAAQAVPRPVAAGGPPGTSSTRSHSPRPATAATIWRASSRMRGRRRSAARGVNERLIVRRSRV